MNEKIRHAAERQLRAGNLVQAVLIQALLDMSGTMGLDVVAEGIETEAQEKKLLDIDCRFGQGYFYARPLPRRRFMRFRTKLGALARSA
jgi:EAL domain-containing protein (putative c-di-GMP-specific phosphodiesterase class I)